MESRRREGRGRGSQRSRFIPSVAQNPPERETNLLVTFLVGAQGFEPRTPSV